MSSSRSRKSLEESAVVVAVRVRPLSSNEKAAGAQGVIFVDDANRSLSVVDPTAYSAAEAMRQTGESVDQEVWSRNFTFDYCFQSLDPGLEGFADQERIYDDLGTRILENAWAGYNTSLFAYGQTGAGKSYTMMGTGAVLDKKLDPRDYGLIPRIGFALFQSIDEALSRQPGSQAENQPQNHPDLADQASLESSFGVEVSYLEIYNETVRDLFDPKLQTAPIAKPRRLRVREHPLKGVYVEHLTTVAVNSYAEIGQLMALGGRARTVAHTNMNQNSSRSHAIFSINFRQRSGKKTSSSGGPGRAVKEKMSKTHLVDLAGSERVDQTGASGERLREARNINKSLATLCDVVKALAANASNRSNDRNENHVPYRNSVLTWLLKESLGGNARTTMLAAVSPCEVHFEETLSTLKYAERAKKMRTRAVVNSKASDEALIAELRQEVLDLRRELAKQTKKTRGGAQTRSVGGIDQSSLPPIAEIPEDYESHDVLEEKLETLQDELSMKEELIRQLSSSIETAALMARYNSGASSSGFTTDNSSLDAFSETVSVQGSESNFTQTSTIQSEYMDMEERTAALKAMGVALPGDEIDPTRPRLVNLNQDPLFSECLIYFIQEGITHVGSEGDIQLSGEDIKGRHAVLTYTHDLVYLCPLDGAITYRNGKLMDTTPASPPRAPADDGEDAAVPTPQPVLLRHRDRIIFGRHHIFRFEQSSLEDQQREWEGADAVKDEPPVDWEFAQRELLEHSPDAPVFADKGKSQLQSLADKVRELEAERQEFQRQLQLQRQVGSSPLAPAAAISRSQSQPPLSSAQEASRDKAEAGQEPFPPEKQAAASTPVRQARARAPVRTPQGNPFDDHDDDEDRGANHQAQGPKDLNAEGKSRTSAEAFMVSPSTMPRPYQPQPEPQPMPPPQPDQVEKTESLFESAQRRQQVRQEATRRRLEATAAAMNDPSLVSSVAASVVADAQSYTQSTSVQATAQPTAQAPVQPTAQPEVQGPAQPAVPPKTKTQAVTQTTMAQSIAMAQSPLKTDSKAQSPLKTDSKAYAEAVVAAYPVAATYPPSQHQVQAVQPVGGVSAVPGPGTGLSQIEAELRHSWRQTHKAQTMAEQAKKRLEQKSQEVRRLQAQVDKLIGGEGATGGGPQVQVKASSLSSPPLTTARTEALEATEASVVPATTGAPVPAPAPAPAPVASSSASSRRLDVSGSGTMTSGSSTTAGISSSARTANTPGTSSSASTRDRSNSRSGIASFSSPRTAGTTPPRIRSRVSHAAQVLQPQDQQNVNPQTQTQTQVQTQAQPRTSQEERSSLDDPGRTYLERLRGSGDRLASSALADDFSAQSSQFQRSRTSGNFPATSTGSSPGQAGAGGLSSSYSGSMIKGAPFSPSRSFPAYNSFTTTGPNGSSMLAESHGARWQGRPGSPEKAQHQPLATVAAASATPRSPTVAGDVGAWDVSLPSSSSAPVSSTSPYAPGYSAGKAPRAGSFTPTGGNGFSGSTPGSSKSSSSRSGTSSGGRLTGTLRSGSSRALETPANGLGASSGATPPGGSSEAESPSTPMSEQARKLQRELAAMRQRVEEAQRRLTRPTAGAPTLA